MKVGYIRVSSKDQNEARQIPTMEGFGVDKIYMEKILTEKNIRK